MMKKHTLCLLLAVCLLLMTALPAAAGDKGADCVVFSPGQTFALVDGVKTACPAALLVNGRTLMPVRFFSERMGWQVNWDKLTATVTVTDGQNTVKLFLDKTAILVNGEEKTLDVPARLYQNTTYIPVRAVAENFGLTVLYSGYSGLPHLIGLFQGEAAFDEKAALAAFTGLDIRYVSEDAGFYAGSDGAFYFLLGDERGRKVRDYQLWGEKKAWYEFPSAKYLFFSQEGAIGSTETVYGFYPDGTVKELYAAQMRDFVFDADGGKLYFTTMLSPMLLIEPEQRENFDGNLFVIDLTPGEKPTAQALGEKGYAYGFTSYQDGSVDGAYGLDGDAGLTYTKDGIITTGLLYAPDMSAWQQSYGQYQVALSGRAQQKLK